MKKMIYIILIVLALLVALVFVITSQPKFGAIPKGERLERIEKLPNFKDGKFHNLSETPQMSEDAKFLTMMKELFFSKNKKPINEIPSIKTDLHNLNPDEDVLIWFGHSSYFIQLDGKRILVDPVFSGSASPFSFNIKAFEGSNYYQPKDIPAVDYLIITHDHWDHLDYKTITELKSKVANIITGLGVGAHFEKWGFDVDRIIETDWFEEVKLAEGFVISCTPARHFSGRGFQHKRALWASFVLKTPSQQIFIGGDGGYDSHFAEIGKKFGEFDLVILENGQYNKAWKYIHMMPEQVLQAAKDLNAKRLFPVHSGKFALANHAWDEPLKRITELNKNNSTPLLTPIIGELVRLKDSEQKFSEWWLDVD
jgi:L-ascorbate metabolism protein UlaG (beta-lactamase superfamily)